MPKAARSEKEIEAVKEEILAQAVDMIIADGYNGLSMRKLAGRLGIAAKTIYNYFTSKDELYLAVVGRGYTELYNACVNACEGVKDPVDRLGAIAGVYLEYGLENANFYNLMFTWHVPKYGDYLGTDLEGMATEQLLDSIRLYNLLLRTVEEATSSGEPMAGEDARFHVIYFWSLLHGYIAGYNNTMLNYMHDDPISIKDRLLDRMMNTIRMEAGQTPEKHPDNP